VAEDFFQEGEFLGMLRVGGQVGEKGALADAEVGDARLHLGTGVAAHHDVIVAGAALEITVVGPLVDLGVCLARELAAEVDDGLETVFRGERELIRGDGDEILHAGDREGDDEGGADGLVPDDDALGVFRVKGEGGVSIVHAEAVATSLRDAISRKASRGRTISHCQWVGYSR
jgi:hypothetical protein